MLGPNLGITDLDAIARLNFPANDVGVDSMEIGRPWEWPWRPGDCSSAMRPPPKRQCRKSRRAPVWGRLLGSGAETTGRVLGVRRIPAVKGQSFAAYDPRAAKGMGVTYATSPMGADHSAGYTMHEKVDHHKKEGQVAASLRAQLRAALFDSLGLMQLRRSGYGRPL